MSGINGWDKTLEKLLVNWSQQVSINEEALRNRGSTLLHWSYVFAIVITIAQASAITVLSAVIISMIEDASSANVGLVVFAAVAELLVSIVQGVDKYFSPASASVEYFNSAKDHNALSMLIDSILALPRRKRDQAHEVIVSIRDQFRIIKKNAPYLPHNKIVHKLEMCIYEDPQKACGKKNEFDISQTVGILNNREESPKTETTITVPKTVQMPSPTPQNQQLLITFQEETAPDEEIVSTTNTLKYRKKLEENKANIKKEDNQNKNGLLKILEYQWGRMEEHDDKHRYTKKDIEKGLRTSTKK